MTAEAVSEVESLRRRVEAARCRLRDVCAENAALKLRFAAAQSSGTNLSDATPRSDGAPNSARPQRSPPGSPSGLEQLAALQGRIDRIKEMLPILSVPHFTFSLVPSHGDAETKEVPIYEIKVNYGETAYAIYRRYSEFRSLHAKLEAMFKDENLPRFPGRQFLFKSTNHDKAAIERRRRDLQIYIRQLVASDDVRASDPVKQFFGQLALDPSGGANIDHDSIAFSNDD